VTDLQKSGCLTLAAVIGTSSLCKAVPFLRTEDRTVWKVGGERRLQGVLGVQGCRELWGGGLKAYRKGTSAFDEAGAVRVLVGYLSQLGI
jgi:hypothetical protein